MKIESHLENLKESVREIEESVTKGIEGRQRTIGFHASSGAVDMLEIILHKNKLIDPGFMLKHEWFNSKNMINTKLDFDFPKKQEIISLMMQIESLRNPFCYGRQKSEEEIIPVIEAFHKLKKIFKELTGDEL